MNQASPVTVTRRCRCRKPFREQEGPLIVCGLCGYEVAPWVGGKLYLCRDRYEREEAVTEALRRFPQAAIVSIRPRKVRDGRVVSPQGRAKSGDLGKPIWELVLSAGEK